MAQAHCTTCNATVTVQNGECLVGHQIPLEAIEAAHVASRGRGRRRPHRRLPSFDVLRSAVGTHRTTRENSVSVVPAPARPTVSPLMEMFGFGETSDPPWEYFEEPAPRAPAKRVLSPIGPLPDAVPKSRPGADGKTRPNIFDALPRLADLVSASPEDHENTGTLIERLWHATDDFEPMDSWMPKADAVDRLSQRPLLRWIAVSALALAAVFIVTALIVSGGGSDSPAPAVQANRAVEIAATNARTLREAVGVLTDPSSTGVQLNEAAVALSEFDSAARDLAAAASLLTDQQASAEMTSAHLTEASQQGGLIERRLGSALTYRLVFERAFLVPELPDTAGITEAADISFALSAMVADTQRALDALPFDPALEDHRVLAAQALADIEVLSGRYVEALRADRAGAAARDSAAIIDIADQTHTVLATTLPELGTQIADQIDGFETTLDGAAAALVQLGSTG